MACYDSQAYGNMIEVLQKFRAERDIKHHLTQTLHLPSKETTLDVTVQGHRTGQLSGAAPVPVSWAEYFLLQISLCLSKKYCQS